LPKSLRGISISNWSKNKMISRTTVSPQGFHSSITIDSPRFHVLSLPDRGDEKKTSKRWRDCPMRDLAPTRCLAHLCLPVFPSLSHLSLLLFPFFLSRPQARRYTTSSLFSLSLRHAISSLLYTVSYM